ncbi:kelch-like protein 17 isoform X2 [Panicum virgatum]|uniref:kelch-like protein 17 isoform X2 n=1 Tax=Panicum virgatum TaxID=38727 RepID=UPI0019D6696F|nr:kelch-like protein 17 isoform X2 [Panicum virgatum]
MVPFMFQRFALAATELNGTIYAAGGYDGSMYLQSAERYDQREGVWVRLPSMNTRRGCHTLTVLGESLYAIGGYNGDKIVSSVEIYDPRLNAWRMGDPMSSPRGYAAAVNLDGSVYRSPMCRSWIPWKFTVRALDGQLLVSVHSGRGPLHLPLSCSYTTDQELSVHSIRFNIVLPFP